MGVIFKKSESGTVREINIEPFSRPFSPAQRLKRVINDWDQFSSILRLLRNARVIVYPLSDLPSALVQAGYSVREIFRDKTAID